MGSKVLEEVRTLDGQLEARHLSAIELAARAGVPVATVYTWRATNKGPRAMRIGKYLRFRREDVLAWEESLLEPKATA
ncbi:helix-turn-helix domain-containing protein [Arthrobacter sp. AL12]|uniref:helix-turn-helix transcriptional regulator n=1 Tax=Arthrobacter sp. AL12 TaxID=3042241 RepID=UPI00249C53F2|nr:helix-turn-helix domain-containing protein [Arthrobacter sp. AL12]MDI3211691.1 helix-turn-helix domain-containing protein [Arthrobacter sp. AL12]